MRHILIIPGQRDAVEEVGNTKIYRLWALPIPGTGYRIAFRPFALRRILQKEQPQIIEVSSFLLLPWICFWLCRNLECRFVSYFHTNFVEAYLKPNFFWLGRTVKEWLLKAGWCYAKALYSHFHPVFVASRSMHETLRNHGVLNTNIVPLGVDPIKFHPSKRCQHFRSQFLLNPSMKLAIYAGRLHPEKRIDWLLNCATELFNHLNVRLLVCGMGPHQRIVERFAIQNRALVYLGVQSKEALATSYASCDLFLVPGTSDTFCLSALEAMSSGLPILAPETSVTREFTLNLCGATYRIDDNRNFVLAAQQVLLHREEMSVCARQRAVSEFSWKQTFNSLLASCRPDYANIQRS